MTDEAEKLAFAGRLNEVCDDMQIPPKGMARQTTLAKLFDVTQKGARKWLEGEGYPTIDKARAIAIWSGIQFEWLMTGRGPKREGEPSQPREMPGAIAENIIAESARMLASQAGNVAQLWLKLPPERRAEVLGQLEREAAARNLKTALKADPSGLSSSDAIFPPVPDSATSPETDPDRKK